MPLSDFLHDLRQIEKTAPAQHGALILEAFRRHTPFDGGAVYFRDGGALRLNAKSQHCKAPDLAAGNDVVIDPRANVVISLRAHRDDFGVVALIADQSREVSQDDLEIVRTVEAVLAI